MFELTLEEAKRKFPICIDILETRVKPERDIVKRKVYRETWWQYAEKGVNLYKAINELDRVLVAPLVSKYFSLSFVPNQYVLHPHHEKFLS